MLHRHPGNPLIRPDDVRPSHVEFEVVGAFNPAATTRGDEVLGLTEAFLFAGAGAVVSTLWRVDDRASSLLMERFYRHLAELPPEEALRRAQLDLLGGPAGSEFRAPYFWAPFVLTAG